MASDKIRSNFLMGIWDHDPGATTAKLVSPDGGTTVRSIDMRQYSNFAVACFSSVLAGAGPTKVEIVGSDSADMSTNVTVIATSGVVAPDAFGDWVIVECTIAEFAQEASDADVETLRYAAGRITCANAGDEAVVIYFGVPNNPRLNLTPSTTIA